MTDPTVREAFHKTLIALGLVAGSVLAGCGGTRVLEEPMALQTTGPLVTASGQDVDAALNWVIVRDGPGTWAQFAEWDEYLIDIHNRGERPISIDGLLVVDSLGTSIPPATNRKALVKGTRRAVKRYRQYGTKVQVGASGGTVLLAGAALTAAGVGAAYALGLGATMGSAVGGGALVAASGVLLVGPILMVGGVSRMVNNGRIDEAIQQRQTLLPLEVPAGQKVLLDIFLPVTPSPTRVEIRYAEDGLEKTLVLDTQSALTGLHIPEGIQVDNESETDSVTEGGVAN